jgi:DNA-binding transcriptional LysR family regulator
VVRPQRNPLFVEDLRVMRSRIKAPDAGKLHGTSCQEIDGARQAPPTALVKAPNSRWGGTWRFRQGSTEVSVSVSGPLRVNAAEGVRATVLADMGLAIASAWMFGPELASGDVQAVLTDWSLPLLDLWAVYPTGRMPTAKARAFAAFVEAELKHESFPVK